MSTPNTTPIPADTPPAGAVPNTTPNTAPTSDTTSDPPADSTETPEVLYQREGELPVTENATEIAHLRAVNTDGESVNATPAQLKELIVPTDEQLRKMVGIDYSSLEEQEVPGEIWPDKNGDPKQVYVKRFQLMFNQEDAEVIALTGTLSNFAVVCAIGNVEYQSRCYANNQVTFDNGVATFNALFYFELGYNGALVLTRLSKDLKGKQLNAVIKYTYQ